MTNGPLISWRETVLIPYLAVLVLRIILGALSTHSFEEKVIEFSVEISILGIGITAATFGNIAAQQVLRDRAARAQAISILLTMLVTAILVNVQRWPKIESQPRKMWLILGIGSVSLAINTYVVSMLKGCSQLRRFGYALASWAVAVGCLGVFQLLRNL